MPIRVAFCSLDYIDKHSIDGGLFVFFFLDELFPQNNVAMSPVPDRSICYDCLTANVSVVVFGLCLMIYLTFMPTYFMV